ncbi:MAG: four helix bundle protein [Candidatus Neomarinimicrobiota bacterium]|jgi:four helix bundle protein
MKTHHELKVWNDSIGLVDDIYDITLSFPDFEKQGLASQMQRAAVSVASNIAEGATRNSDKKFIRFLNYSTGSISELETQLIIARNRKYVHNIDQNIELIVTIRKELFGLIRYVKNKTK